MNNINHLSLDGRTLQTFLIVLEERSVSKAASRIGITQSAVSHTLDRLREILGDDLFVRLGRGIEATERARSLESPVRALLDDMKAITHEREFDPTAESMNFTIAANDFQRDILFPSLVRNARRNNASLTLSIPPSGIPTLAMLRQGRCDLIITPFPPVGPDVYQTRLFDDEIGICYDSKIWKKPPTLKDLKSCGLVSVAFGDGSGGGPMPKVLANKTPVVSVPNFTGIVSFIRGTDLVSIQPRLLGSEILKPLTVSAAPFKTLKFSMYMTWHRRSRRDPAHNWIRTEIKKSADRVLALTP